MVVPLSMDLRMRVAAALEEGETVRAAAKRFGVSVASAVRIGQRQRSGRGGWRPVNRPDVHMGHHPVDAVDWWNSTGRYTGARSQTVRDWMLDSNNYRFEYGPLNSSRGGATRSTYLPPVP
ncbi:MAG: hypothetical protein RLZZ437_27 [Pseudomonadota bacterium]|jgi:hypothetical protein